MTRLPTLQDLIDDPLIAMVNAADNVNQRQFAQLIESAARVFERQATVRRDTEFDRLMFRICSREQLIARHEDIRGELIGDPHLSSTSSSLPG